MGTIQPMAELAGIARRHGALFHTDAVQAVGKIAFDVRRRADRPALAFRAQAARAERRRGLVRPRRRRALAALARAAARSGAGAPARKTWPRSSAWAGRRRLPRLAMADEAARLVRIREHSDRIILAAVGDAYLIGHRYRRLPGHICLGFDGHGGRGDQASAGVGQGGRGGPRGSACSSNHAGQPSHVLEALGFDPIKARGSLRITLGRFNTMEEAERFLELLPRSCFAAPHPA